MNKGSGQVTVFAALMMLAFVSAAALCINASYSFHQHTQMQAQVDTTTLYAAGTGCDSSLLTLPSGLTVVSPPVFGPYTGNRKYCEGVYQKNVGSLFGKILAFPSKISVHSVAVKGGTTEVPFTFLGLSPCGTNYPTCKGNSSDCSVSMTGGSNITVYSNVLSNASMTYADCESNNTTLGPGNPYVSSAHMLDPYKATGPTNGPAPIQVSCSAPKSTCTYPNTGTLACLTAPLVLQDKDKYLQPVATGLDSVAGYAVAEINSIGSASSITESYLPYCSGSTLVPGVYLTDTGIKASGGGIVTISSTMVLSTTATRLDISGSTLLNWSSPATSSLKGYTLYQETYPGEVCATATGNIQGGSSSSIDGLIDLACTNLSFTGGSATNLDASFVAWTINFGGGGSGANVHVPDSTPYRGAFLVQ